VTILEMRAAGTMRGTFDPRPGDLAVTDLVVRLRESAGRMVPFSQHKIMLRAAASAIERLDAEVRSRTGDVARLTAELHALRVAHGSS
jgi:hypothetical protein